MTVETQLNIAIADGDDVAVTFPFTFPVYDENHLLVYLRDTTTQELTLVDNGDYSVTGINDETGGSVTFLAAPSSDYKVLLARILPFRQDLDILNQGGFFPRSVERQLDLIEMQLQQLFEGEGRSLRGQLGEDWAEMPEAPLRRGQLIAFTDDEIAQPTIADGLSVLRFLATILVAGFGIELNFDYDAGTLTIINSEPGSDAWLLESGIDSDGSAPEEIREVMFASLRGAGCDIIEDTGAGTITIDLTGATTAEVIRDVIGVALVGGTGISITVDDVGNTISLDLGDVSEIARDAIGAALVAGSGIGIAVSDGSDTITVSTKANVLAVVSAPTVTPTFAYDQVNITAQAEGLTLANPTGTVVDGHGIIIRIDDDGTNRAINYGTKYRAFGSALPTTTTANKTLYIGMVYNAADIKWDVLAVREEV